MDALIKLRQHGILKPSLLEISPGWTKLHFIADEYIHWNSLMVDDILVFVIFSRNCAKLLGVTLPISSAKLSDVMNRIRISSNERAKTELHACILEAIHLIREFRRIREAAVGRQPPNLQFICLFYV